MEVSANKSFVRPVVICVFRKEDRILVSSGHDPVKGETYYRPLGGMIEFQEESSKALIREIHEEINEDITDINYLGTLENIFINEGKPGHEILIVYDAKFLNDSVYSKESLEVKEEGWDGKAYWMQMEEFISKKFILYPDGLIDLLLKTPKT
jgi:ADP-ribose pyrophosphatase YjhB (NUDIX family)